MVEPVKEEGKLVFRVTVPYRDARDYGALTGQVLDEQGTPVAGAQVGVWGEGESRETDDLPHRATTDPQGRYRLREIPRRAIDGQPLQVRLIVTRDGFAGLQTPFLPLAESSVEKPQVRRVHPARARRLAQRDRGGSSRATRGGGHHPAQSAGRPGRSGRDASDGANRRRRALRHRRRAPRPGAVLGVPREDSQAQSLPRRRLGRGDSHQAARSGGGSPSRLRGPPRRLPSRAPWVSLHRSGRWAPGRMVGPARSRTSVARSSFSTSGG